MRYEIFLAPEAIEDIKRLKKDAQSGVRKAIEKHLRHEPRKVSRSRIKRLRGLSRPQYRLRTGEFRIFYDVAKERVEVLAVVRKSDASIWLEEIGKKS